MGRWPPQFDREALWPNTSSAKKATRKIARRTEVNKNRRSRVRSFIRKVEEALASGDKDAAALLPSRQLSRS